MLGLEQRPAEGHGCRDIGLFHRVVPLRKEIS
jgi:hypothetical protein